MPKHLKESAFETCVVGSAPSTVGIYVSVFYFINVYIERVASMNMNNVHNIIP